MVREDPDAEVLHQLEHQNPGVAQAFGEYRRRARPSAGSRVLRGGVGESSGGFAVAYPVERREALTERHNPKHWLHEHRACRLSLAALLLTAGVAALALALGGVVIAFLRGHWAAILLSLGCACLGAGIVLLVARIGATPLRATNPPSANSDAPLQELVYLAERASSRLRVAYRAQVLAVVAVGAVFVSLVAWSVVMVSRKETSYASAFGSGSVAMAILTRWKWQPFDRINQARRLADNADVLATGLRLRMHTISEIADPRLRADEQWRAVMEYIGARRARC